MSEGAALPTLESPVSFVIPGDPVAWMRPRSNTRGKFVSMFNAPDHDDYLVKVRAVSHETMAGRAPIKGAVAVTILAKVAIPASWSKAKRRDALAGLLDHTISKDADNIAKIVNDGMQGIVFVNDKQVTPLLVTKRYAEQPSVLVRVTPRGGANV